MIIVKAVLIGRDSNQAWNQNMKTLILLDIQGEKKVFTQIFECDDCCYHTQQFGCSLELLQKTVQ